MGFGAEKQGISLNPRKSRGSRGAGGRYCDAQKGTDKKTVDFLYTYNVYMRITGRQLERDEKGRTEGLARQQD